MPRSRNRPEKKKPFIPHAGAIKELIRKHGRFVFEQSFRSHDGKDRKFLLFGFNAIPSIVFPLTVDNNVVAIRQFRYGANKYVLEIPGGNTEKGRTAEERAGIEIMEETGYTAAKVIRLGQDIWFDPASFRARFTPLLALGCRRVHKPKLEPMEVIETVEIPLAEWIKKVREGKEILDAKTLATTVLALLRLQDLALKHHR